jgi:hypothetical protein
VVRKEKKKINVPKIVMGTLSIPLGYGGLIPQGPAGVGVIDFFHFF